MHSYKEHLGGFKVRAFDLKPPGVLACLASRRLVALRTQSSISTIGYNSLTNRYWLEQLRDNEQSRTGRTCVRVTLNGAPDYTTSNVGTVRTRAWPNNKPPCT